MKEWKATIRRKLPNGGVLEIQIQPQGGLIAARSFIDGKKFGGLYFYPSEADVVAAMIKASGVQFREAE
ncbi:MAG: hypothetical protein H8E62_03690 [Planctomycetes bacterium]|nr:hypothetical protein [Planctomycetota bacterium]